MTYEEKTHEEQKTVKIKIIKKLPAVPVLVKFECDMIDMPILTVGENNYKNCVEYFDDKKLSIIVNNFEDFEHLVKKDSKYEPLTILKKYLKKSKKGKINVKYIQKNNIGRYYAISGLSLGTMQKVFRHTIANEHYVDIDMVNAHPVILLHLCKKYNFNCDKLEKYIINREEILRSIDKDRNNAKECIISLINNGSLAYKKLKKKTKYIRDLKDEIKMIRMEMVMKFSEKFNNFKKQREDKGIEYNHDGSFISSILCDVENKILMTIYEFYQNPKNVVLVYDGLMIDKNINPDIKNCEKYIYKKLGIKLELKIKPFDKCLNLSEYKYEQDEEDNNDFIVDEYKDRISPRYEKYILQILDKYKNYQVENISSVDDKIYINFYGDGKPCPLMKYDIENCCDIHDEPYVIFYKDLLQYDFRCKNEKCKNLKNINYCEIFDDYKFSINEIKKINKTFSEVYVEDEESMKKFYEGLNRAVRYTNLFFIFINGYSSSIYYHIEYMKNGQRRTYPKQSLKDTLSNVNISYTQISQGKNGLVYKQIENNLFYYWNTSPDRREKSKVVVYPEKYLCQDYQFNLFDKFSITYEDCKNCVDDCKVILNHIENIWSRSNAEKNEYILNWLAYCIQKPQSKTGVALTLISKEGAGKGVIIDKLKEIYGEKYYLHCQGFEDVFGNFNSQLTGKCLTYLDECTWGGNKKDSGRLKTFITEKEIQINQKGIPKITMSSNNNVIISSNEKWVVPATHKGRRYYICYLDDKYAGVSNDEIIEYFEGIRNCSTKAFAKFLYERNIEKFNPRKWGVNEDINEQVEVGEDSFVSYIKSCCDGNWEWCDYDLNDGEDGFIKKSLIYKSYVKYSKSGSKSFDTYSCKLFWKEFTKIYKGKYDVKQFKGSKYIKLGKGSNYLKILNKYLN
jgi:hypothetical protein